MRLDGWRKHMPADWMRLAIPVVLALGGGYLFAASPSGVTPAAFANVALSPAPTIGNPVGRVTIVEFFDYRCPYCKVMEPRLRSVLAEDKGVRLVLKQWPVFGGVSILAARVALASEWQGKFQAVHEALFALPLPFDGAAVRAAARGAGVDLARLDADLAARGAELDMTLAANAAEAGELKFAGTPGFVIGRQTAPGALPRDLLDKLIAQARAAGS